MRSQTTPLLTPLSRRSRFSKRRITRPSRGLSRFSKAMLARSLRMYVSTRGLRVYVRVLMQPCNRTNVSKLVSNSFAGSQRSTKWSPTLRLARVSTRRKRGTGLRRVHGGAGSDVDHLKRPSTSCCRRNSSQKTGRRSSTDSTHPFETGSTGKGINERRHTTSRLIQCTSGIGTKSIRH